MINSNSEQILNYIFTYESGFEELMKSFNEINIDTKLKAAMFLIDVCNFSQMFQSDLKQTYFSRILDSKLFLSFVRVVALNEIKIEEEIKIEHFEEVHEEYKVNKLEILKSKIVELLINCLQNYPCIT